MDDDLLDHHRRRGVAAIPVSGGGRYVRMYGTQRVTQYGYSLWEFQVFGS